MAQWLASAGIVGLLLSVAAVYTMSPERAPRILFNAQVRLLQGLFVAGALVLGYFLAASWIRSLLDSRKQAQRRSRLNEVTEELKRKRIELQGEAAAKSRLAKEEEEAQKKAAAGLAAERAREERALAARQHQPGGGDVHASEDALARAWKKQQESLLRQAQLRLQVVREAEEARRRQALEQAAALKAEAATRQPGGGASRASEEELAAVRARQQEALRKEQEEFKRRQREKEEEARRQARDRAAASQAEARARSAARQPGGGAVRASESPGNVSRAPARPSVGNGHTWDGPIFPGDELRGWVSPASEDAEKLRAQQDAELEQSLKMDRAREEARLAKERAERDARERQRKFEEAKEERRAVLLSLLPPEPPSETGDRVSIAVRLPNSTVQKRVWQPSNTVEDLYNWVESLKSLTLRTFRLVKPFPREFLERDKSCRVTLLEANLCPQALLVVELQDD